MKTAQRFVVVLVPLSALALSAACADSPIAPSHPDQPLSNARPGLADAAAFDSSASISAVDPLRLTAAEPQQASCTVQLLKTWAFDKDKGKEGDWVAYDGSVLEIVPPEELFLKYDLTVNIPAKHQVTFQIDRSVLRPNTGFNFPRTAPKWKPPALNGQLAGNQSVQLEFRIPKTVGIGNDHVEVLGNSFDITDGWQCITGLADVVSSGTLGTFSFKGVEKKKKK